MRNRLTHAAAYAVVAVLSLTGCGGSGDDKPSSGLTEITVPCDEYADTAKKITDAQAELYGGSGSTEAIDSLVSELDALKEGAPADVKAALTEMGEAFEKARRVMQDPTTGDVSELAELGPQLSADSQKITAYIVSKCS